MLGRKLSLDGAVKLRIAGFVNFAHASGSDGGVHFVRTEFFAASKGNNPRASLFHSHLLRSWPPPPGYLRENRE